MKRGYGLDVRVIPGGQKIDLKKSSFGRNPEGDIARIQDGILKVMAEDMRDYIQDYMESGKVHPALKWTTAHARIHLGFGTNPIYATGSLAESVETKRAGVSHFMIGIPWSKVHKNWITGGGMPAAQLAEQLESERSMTVTDTMAKFFHYCAYNGIFPRWFFMIQPGMQINIPGRPFFKQATTSWIRSGKPAQYNKMVGTAIDHYVHMSVMGRTTSMIRAIISTLRIFLR